MAESCHFSFDDLHEARFGRTLTQEEKSALYGLKQDKRNNIVRRWAEDAGWLSEDRVGTDAVLYTAFWRGGE